MSDFDVLEPLTIAPTPTTPQVVLDTSKDRFEIKGRSLPEHAISFYQPILDWMRRYSKFPNAQTIFHLHLDYFNTPSAKPLLDILKTTDKISSEGHKTKIIWYYNGDDEDMREVGEEYALFINTEVEFIRV